MIRQVKKSLFGLAAVMMLTMAIAFESFAADARISFSDPSTKVGEEVKVTMKFTSTSGDVLGDTNVLLDYDATMLEFINETENVDGGTGKIRVRSFPGITEAVTELRFKALRAGTTTITVASWDGYDNSGQRLNMQKEGSSTITIEGLATSSSDATLQHLLISPGTLTPAFTPATENYTVTVGLDTERLTVDAQPNNENAKVEREGGDSLQEGENTVLCRVVAEDGTTIKDYTITVNKVAGGETAGSAEGESQVGAEEPEVLAELTSLAKKLQIISLPSGVEVPEGLKESNITIGQDRVTGWIPEGEEDASYCVFYGINDNGIYDFYRYDRRDKTIQRYFENLNNLDPAILEAGEKYNELVDEYNRLRIIAISGISVLVLIAVVLLILLFMAKRSRFDKGEGRYEDRERPMRRQEEKGDLRTRTTNEGRLTREERYMRGEGDEFEEEDEEDDLPEVRKPEPPVRRQENRQPRRPVSREAENKEERKPAAGGAKVSRPNPAVSRDLDESEDLDDFEIFDLDEDR